MHAGEYVGVNFDNQNKRLLILGESHHGGKDEEGKQASYTSSNVVNDYLSAKRGTIKMSQRWYFFTKIAHMVDYTLNKEKTIDFWEKVAFGNYIDVSCGVKDGFANKYLSNPTKTKQLNNDLFEFVNKKRVDFILCVSPLSFSCLPMCENVVKSEINNKVSLLSYTPNSVIENGIILTHPLTVYCTPHPSGYGFKPREYNGVLNSIIDI